jgi:hypothetical protein
VINFRYHVVSLTAIFLALALGMVLGTAALNGPVADYLSSQVSSLRQTNADLRGQVQELQTRADSQDSFVEELAPTLLTGRLKGRSVAVVAWPGADEKDRDGVVEMLARSGATVSGVVTLTPQFIDPAESDALLELVTRLVPAGVTLPNNGVGAETASALVGTVIAGGSVTVPAATRSTVVSGFATIGALTVDRPVTGAAQAVVVVTGPAQESKKGEPPSVMPSVLVQFAKVSPHLVVAGPTATQGSLVAGVRGDSTLTDAVSTVDGVSLAEGRAVAVMAVVEEFAGRNGHYGTGDKATARVPHLPS